MKTLRSKGGFSLIELLTVIAIIAILAAIIFPVMSTVKRRAQTVQCMTNLHDIAMAMKLFQQDNRQYPATLTGYVQLDAGGNIIPFERSRGDGLYPEYVKNIKAFHCPLSLTTDTSGVIDLGGYQYYAYDSYDVFYDSPVTAGNTVSVGIDALRYTKSWADDVTKVAVLNPFPPSTPDSPDLQAYDYKRQLRFRSPSDDTVVTWCSYHNRGSAKATLPVLFLDGHCDQMQAVDVEGPTGSGGSRWRTQPKR